MSRPVSRLSPADGISLAFGDLHNHSLLSDGLGDPDTAFAQMRAAGLDVAALTDHASIPHHRLEDLELADYPDADALALARLAPHSIDDDDWQRLDGIAERFDVPGEFVAMRGFEWTEPWLGHVNVWFSSAYLPVTTPGTVEGLHSWLAREEPQALFGYNHPGREPGRLHDFAVADDARVARRMVALEAFNRTDDYLLWDVEHGMPSPLLSCLDAGWRPSLIGCSDEHGRSYGLAGRGRTGLWVRELARAGVREALQARRTYATREAGLVLDATLDGVRMGGTLPAPTTGAELAVDLAWSAGSGVPGMPVQLQLLASDGAGMPVVVALHDAAVGAVARVAVSLPDPVPPYLVLRVAQPGRPASRRLGGARGRRPELPAELTSWALGYASPWWAGPGGPGVGSGA